MKVSAIYSMILLFGLTWSAVKGQEMNNSKPPFGNNVTEQIYVHCDKQVCLAGDTIWWKGYIVAGNRLIEGWNNIYMELFNDSGKMISHSIFPAFHGQAIGQFATFDSLKSGIYWMRFFTHYQANTDSTDLTVVPISVYHSNDKSLLTMINKVKQIKPLPNLQLIALKTDTISNDSGGYNSWHLSINDTTVYHYSCAITDADQAPAIDMAWNNLETTTSKKNSNDLESDTDFLQWQCHAAKKNGKLLKNGSSIMVMLVKDSTILLSKVLHVDSTGRFSLSHLFFFGKANIFFQLNSTGQDNKDVQLIMNQFHSPTFHMPATLTKKDGVLIAERLPNWDTVRVRTKGRQLKEVTIKGWKSSRKELDHTYTSGAFSEPALYSFDIRNVKHDDLWTYLESHLPGFRRDNDGTPMYFEDKLRLLFYVDEQLKRWDELDYDLADIAYIKAFESDFIGNDPFTKWVTGVGGFTLKDFVVHAPIPMIISIYTRKGKDVRKVPGLNEISVTGYEPIAKFQSKSTSRVTLLWEPIEDTNNIRLRFINNAITKHFRITIMGFNNKGEEIKYTTVLPNGN
jgi:hypothetical protein